MFIRNLVHPTSAHLNGDLALLGTWNPAKGRWGVLVNDYFPKNAPLPSDNPFRVAVKEANIQDASNEDILAHVNERLVDDTLVGVPPLERPTEGFHARFGRLDFVLDRGRFIGEEDLPKALVTMLAEASVRVMKQDLNREELPEHGDIASHWLISAWFGRKTKTGKIDHLNAHRKHSIALYKAGCFGPLVRLAHRAATEADETKVENHFKGSLSAFGIGTVPNPSHPTMITTSQVCEKFVHLAMYYATLAMYKAKECGAAVLADPELDPTHPTYPHVIDALVEFQHQHRPVRRNHKGNDNDVPRADVFLETQTERR